uniref:K Homology domain-containing protein n=1 Tax=Sphenodon punctatus TaxID=8508 RepID=A0A8D0L1Q9_SPHPU
MATEDSGCSACTSENGIGVEDPLQSTSLSLASEQCSDSLSTSITEDSSLEQRLVPSEKPPAPQLPENKVPYSNGVLKGDSSDLSHEQHWSVEADGDHSGGNGRSVQRCCSTGSNKNKHSKAGLTLSPLLSFVQHLVGRLIGKQGRYVNFLKQSSGAKIYISTLPYTQDFQICHIEGTQHHVDKVLNLIAKKFKDLSLTNIYAPPPPSLALHSLPMTSWVSMEAIGLLQCTLRGATYDDGLEAAASAECCGLSPYGDGLP